MSELSVDCNLEALYLSVFDSEYRTRNRVKFCVGLYKSIIVLTMLLRITDMIRIYKYITDKKVDRVNHVELEIFYFMLPSLLNNSQN